MKPFKSFLKASLCAGLFTGCAATAADTKEATCDVDECNVCDNDPTNDCTQDCSGAWGGTATVDECGVCDDDPANDCAQDCLNASGGTATVDECGVCDDDPANDCAQDCSGVWGGAAAADECGVCDDDPANDCAQDCNGVWGGAAAADECGVCDDDLANDCLRDCNGVWGGTATIDDCAQCVGGTTGLTSCAIATLEAIADAEISLFDPDGNSGTATSLTVDSDNFNEDSDVYLRFDLGSIPPGSVIASATLQMLAYTGYAWGGDGNVYTYLVPDDGWDEATITWNNKPARTSTSLGYWWLWYDGSYMDNLALNFDPALVGALQLEADGDGVVSLCLSSPGYQTSYRSREYTTVSARPTLRIEYTAPATTTAAAEPPAL